MIELKSVRCAAEEQETTITIMRDENKIRLYTSDNTRVSKMQKLINAPDTTWTLVKTAFDREGNPTGYFFECSDKKMLGLRAKKQAAREMTEEERAILAERCAKLHTKRQSKTRKTPD